MGNNKDWTLEGFQLFLEPLKLLLTNVRGITTFVVFGFLIAVEDNQIQTINVLGVVTPLHTPEFRNRIEGMPAINLVVSENIQGSGMRLFKSPGYGIIFLCRISEVAELYKSIGAFLFHGIEKGLQACWPIVHHILVKVSNQTELDGLFDFPQNTHNLIGQDD